MKTYRLVLLACSAYAGGVSLAHAQPVYTVIDPSAISRSAQEAAQALSQATQQLEELQRQYAQLQQTYGALAHGLNVDNMTPGLNTSAILNPLSSIDQIPNVANGSNLGSFGGVAGQFLSQNRYYAPQGNDPAAQEMNRQAQATSGIQAMAYANLQSTQERIDQLPEPRGEISVAKNEEDISAVNARIAADQDDVQTLQAQAQQLQLLQSAQNQVNEQRAQQKRRQDADSLFNDTAALN